MERMESYLCLLAPSYSAVPFGARDCETGDVEISSAGGAHQVSHHVNSSNALKWAFDASGGFAPAEGLGMII